MRKYVSLILLWSLIVLIISGIVLYIMPHGRVAYWTGWTLFGLDKDQWSSVHIMFGIIMLVFGIWHVVLNWSAVKHYLFKVAPLSKEAFLTLIISLFVFWGSVFNIQPFKAVIDFEEYLKNLWPAPEISPPVPHAELLSLEKLAVKIGVSKEAVFNVLKEHNIKFRSGKSTLKEIARENNLTPSGIYKLIVDSLGAKQKSGTLEFTPGSGLGRMKLSDVCKKMNISLKKCVQILKSKGLNASSDETMKEIASKGGVTPFDIVEMLKEGR